MAVREGEQASTCLARVGVSVSVGSSSKLGPPKLYWRVLFFLTSGVGVCIGAGGNRGAGAASLPDFSPAGFLILCTFFPCCITLSLIHEILPTGLRIGLVCLPRG
ncbi:hypothetical protein F5X97DRAFT_258362 [Nemania serpens]|nr:hypothetical protein F5X97DRAFT_258362 [Nemania serpens]